MKHVFPITITILFLFVLITSCSKDKEDQVSDSDKFIGNYECITGDLLNISKVDNNKILLSFIHGTDPNSSWNHTFTAIVSGTSLVISEQYWASSHGLISATGTLVGDVLTIDYYHHSDGLTENGLIYNKIK